MAGKMPKMAAILRTKVSVKQIYPGAAHAYKIFIDLKYISALDVIKLLMTKQQLWRFFPIRVTLLKRYVRITLII